MVLGLVDRAMHEAVPAIAALGVSPIVRIPGMEPWMVKRMFLLVPSYIADSILIQVLWTLELMEYVPYLISYCQ